MGHEWDASVISRIRLHAGCPYCSGKFVIPGITDVFTANPEAKKMTGIIIKNKNLDPSLIKAGSNVKVLWKCQKCGMSYEASLYNHVIVHTSCPYCVNQVFEFTRANREGEVAIAKNGEIMKIQIVF